MNSLIPHYPNIFNAGFIGFLALVVSLAGLGVAVYLKLPVTKVVEKFFKLMTVATIFSIAFSKCVYISSYFVSPKKLAPGGNTGKIVRCNIHFQISL